MKKCKNAKVHGGWRLGGGGPCFSLLTPSVCDFVSPYQQVFSHVGTSIWVEPCLAWESVYQHATGSSLTDVTVLCPWARGIPRVNIQVLKIGSRSFRPKSYVKPDFRGRITTALIRLLQCTGWSVLVHWQWDATFSQQILQSTCVTIWCADHSAYPRGLITLISMN